MRVDSGSVAMIGVVCLLLLSVNIFFQILGQISVRTVHE